MDLPSPYAESPSKQSKELDVICQICQKWLEEPRILDCLHYFCQQCIENNLDSLRSHEGEEDDNFGELYFVCRKCEEKTVLPREGASKLPLNYLANNAIDHLLIQNSKEAEIACTNCSDGGSANSRCVECTEFLCANCVTAHRRFKLTKDHKIVPLNALHHSKSSVHRPVICSHHAPEPFMFFCEKCEELICKECTILTHRGHKYEGLKDALADKRPYLIGLLDICEHEKIPPIENAVDEVSDMAARLHARTIAVKQTLRACADECIQRIERCCETMLEEVDMLYKRKGRVLEQQHLALKRELYSNITSRDFVNYTFKSGNEAEIFSLFDAMTRRLKNINARVLDYKEPDENDVIEHSFNPDNIRSIERNIGKIVTTEIFVAHCFAEGLGLVSGKVGIECHFTLHARNKKNVSCVESDHDEAIKVKIQAPEGFYINNRVTNNGDGTYDVRYTPVTKGKHELSIKIRGKLIPNGVFHVHIYEGIDYTKISGIFLSIGGQGTKVGELRQPWAAVVGPEGFIFVTDHGNHRVQVFDSFGSPVREFGSRGSRDGAFNGPTGIAMDSAGILVVADWDNHRVQVFGPDGKFIGKFGSRGASQGQLEHPAGVAINRRGEVVVVERDNHRVQVFELDGKSLLMFGSKGSGHSHMDSPTHVAVTKDEVYLISDAGNHRVVAYSTSGDHVATFGAKGTLTAEFNRSSGIAVDEEGFILVSDFYNHRVHVYDHVFNFVCTFGKEGKALGEFKFPSGIAFTQEGRVVVVDRYNHRIQIF